MRFSYPFLRRLGLGAHLAVIVALAAVPVSLLVIGFIEAERREAIQDAQVWAQRAAIQAAERHRDSIAKAHAVLDAAALRLDVAVPPCRVPPDLARIVWLIAPGGGSACSSEPGFPLAELVDDIAEDAGGPGRAVVGPYRTDAQRVQLFAALTRQTADGVTWHLVKAIDLQWTPVLDKDLAEPPQLVAMAVDDDGRIFHRVGAGADIAARSDLTLPPEPADADPPTRVDIDGVKRIFGTAALPESDFTVMVGLSRDAVTATAQREVIGSLALFAAVLAVSALIAWLVIERMVLQSVRKLRDAAVATASGERGRRVVITDGPVELRELADAFNDMTDKLEFQAFHDQLTGLANRRYLKKRMKQFLADGQPFAVLAIDLDGFKSINDQHGHAVGDFVLAEAGQRLSAGAGEGAIVGRTGGDEFLAMIATDGERNSERAAATQAAARMLEQLTRPVALDDDTRLTIGGSIGIAFWPHHGKTADEIVHEADEALYRAKQAGRNRYAVNGEVGRPIQAA